MTLESTQDIKCSFDISVYAPPSLWKQWLPRKCPALCVKECSPQRTYVSFVEYHLTVQSSAKYVFLPPSQISLKETKESISFELCLVGKGLIGRPMPLTNQLHRKTKIYTILTLIGTFKE